MSLSVGKKFENDFKKSVPNDIYYYRYRDSTSAWQGDSDKVRFQHTNIADNQLFYQGHLFILELKSVAGASIPYKNIFDDSKKTSLQKMYDMINAAKFPQLISGYVVNFRKYNRTWFMHSNQLKEYLEVYRQAKASIPVGYFDTYCQPVNLYRKGKAIRYDIKRFVETAINGDYLREQRGLF